MPGVEELFKLDAEELAGVLSDLSEQEAQELLYDWAFWARENQLPPEGLWRVWLVLAGRGFGKTRTGAEFVRMMVEKGEAKRVALVAPTPADARDVMIEGESGLLSISPPWFYPVYEPSKRRLTWPNGAMAIVYSGANPEQLRGPQHDLAWCDELAAWKYPQETWDNLMFGLRLGNDPKAVVTTTPKPIPIIKNLVEQKDVVVTRGSTYENRINLPEAFIEQIIDKYEGTNLGRQELYAEILDDTEGALWKRDQIEANRVVKPPELVRVVVAVDPAVTNNPNSDETGIVVAGIDKELRGYVLEDYTMKGSPNQWASVVVSAYYKWKADRVVAEVNNGGDLVEHTIRTIDRRIAYRAVHAARGKQVRAEPVAALYEQNKIHHVGQLPNLEDEMCTWVPGIGDSPNRVDALVWAFWDLILNRRGKVKVKARTV